MDEIDALAFLAVVETLLCDVQRVLRLGHRLLQDALAAQQSLDLRDHVVGLVQHLRLPELDVADPVSEPLADVRLRALRLVVDLTTQSCRVLSHPFRAATDAVRRHVVAAIGGHPVVGRVAGVEGVAGGGEHGRDLDAVEFRQRVPVGHRLRHASGLGYGRLDTGRGVVGAGAPRQGGQRTTQGRGRRVRVVRLVGRLHHADGRQEGGDRGAHHVRTRHVGGRLRLAEVLHV